ncbi:hypothetical protein BU24DRAFT_85413 [Aaosphaeria arxii CBS 175.79]|uniref:Uncharacterized protein n=1 Tax=Aaosphaeria arxii CBS 175.79 TaxID=1450172 RepID=A0A6A5X8J2_9PLEO|nr:uncharacterized protein BU24DRAFT_85413 [Aaosphaeria arxii CBS 175.79]KAF2009236.1 hypothetical protein BU24DRAFT_85413 [Aaosphaeria arxii CBS 175.79]
MTITFLGIMPILIISDSWPSNRFQHLNTPVHILRYSKRAIYCSDQYPNSLFPYLYYISIHGTLQRRHLLRKSLLYLGV